MFDLVWFWQVWLGMFGRFGLVKLASKCGLKSLVVRFGWVDLFG